MPSSMGDPETCFWIKARKIHGFHEILRSSSTIFVIFWWVWKEKGSQYVGFDVGSKGQNFTIVINYIGHEITFTLVAQYDVGLFLPLLIQCYKVLMSFMFGEEVQV
jgi:hypothetical protein